MKTVESKHFNRQNWLSLQNKNKKNECNSTFYEMSLLTVLSPWSVLSDLNLFWSLRKFWIILCLAWNSVLNALLCIKVWKQCCHYQLFVDKKKRGNCSCEEYVRPTFNKENSSWNVHTCCRSTVGVLTTRFNLHILRKIKWRDIGNIFLPKYLVINNFVYVTKVTRKSPTQWTL